METFSSPHQAIDLSTPLYYQLVHTLTNLLPPPLDDTQEALRTRNHAAIAKVAALLPVNSNEADLAAQCIAARAQAEDVLRLLRQHTGDIGLTIRLNAQYSSMVRTSLSVLGRLMRVQAVRHKRQASDSAANQDTWTQHVAERSMLTVVDPDTEPREATSPKAAPQAWPGEAPTTLQPGWLDWTPPERPENTPPAPPAWEDQSTAENASKNETNSQETPFETYLSKLPWKEMSTGSGKAGPLDVVHKVLARSRLAARESPANGRETPRKAPKAARSSG